MRFLNTPLVSAVLSYCLHMFLQYKSNNGKGDEPVDTPNICNVEGDNNRLSSGLKSMKCAVFSISEIT